MLVRFELMRECAHVMSRTDRDAVRLLLDHPEINDTIRDDQGRTPLECAANAEVSSAIEGELDKTCGREVG